MTTSIKEYIRQLHTVYCNSLNENSPSIDVIPTTIKLPLHKHQRAALHRMETLEKEMTQGTMITDECVYSNYGILGDSVGVGKSLMILSHIARIDSIDPLEKYHTVYNHAGANFFSVKVKTHDATKREAGSLIIVPHTLYRQWTDYITKQTTLSNVCISRANIFNEEDTLLEAIYRAKVVLISNTLLKHFIPFSQAKEIKWKRVFIDEADTIHMPGLTVKQFPAARFTWFVSASWINLLYTNQSFYADKHYIQTSVLNNPEYSHMKMHLKSIIDNPNFYAYIYHYVKSYGLLRDILSVSHPLRAHAVIKCSDDFVKASISLPALYRSVIWCKAPISHRLVQGMVTTQIQQMLHAGDVAGALKQLGVKGQDSKSLVNAVTASLKKELEQEERTLEFRESYPYVSPKAKEDALKVLRERIEKIKESIRSVQERIENLENEMCPICYDDPAEALVTPCCSRVFCAACLLMSMTRRPECPLCRGPIHPSKCTKLITKSEEGNEIVDSAAGAAEPIEEKKPEALLRILRENPDGRFLIFSRYDNPFDTIETAVEGLGIQVKYLKGNKDAIASTLRAFDAGTVRCLLLNARSMGAGLNIIGATHVILLHAMTHEEEKQILGRAYRMGRKGPLHFIKLLHKNEESYSAAEDDDAVDADAE